MPPPLSREKNYHEGGQMGLDGPSRTIIVEPVEQPAPEPREEPAPERQPEPRREREPVPA